MAAASASSSSACEACSEQAATCGRREPFSTFRSPNSAPASPTCSGGVLHASCSLSGEGSSKGAGLRREGNEENLKMLVSGFCEAVERSPDAQTNADNTAVPGAQKKADDDAARAAKLLQQDGKYDAWAPFLRGMLPERGSSMLLGQIQFDVTSEDQRGSWLVPEEVLALQKEPAVEEHSDRQVFTNTPVSEEEQQAIDEILVQLLELQEREEAENLGPDALRGVEPAWLEQLILRYLHSCSFDKQKTFELLQSTLEFRTQQLPVLESEVYNELRNVGACYWHGRDRKMRPLLVLSLQRLQQLQREGGTEKKVTRMVVFCLEFFLRYLCVAGAVENWVILCDLSGTSISSFPLPLLVRLMQLIQGAYRGRLHRFYILYAPRLFHFVAKPLLSSLPASTAKKLRVFTQLDDWKQERRIQFADHQLEKKFGGTAPDVTENWYPFRFFPGPFDPAVSRTRKSTDSTAVRWESERTLHAKVHPSVHTGASLHTSLLIKRTRGQVAVAGSGSDAGTLRYAAWLHDLPELTLAPETVQWARQLLQKRLREHHQRLLKTLGGARTEGRLVARRPCVSSSGPSSVPTVAGAPSCSRTSSTDRASQVRSPEQQPSRFKGSMPTSRPSIIPAALAPKLKSTSSSPKRPAEIPPPDALVSPVADNTPAAAASMEEQAQSVPSQRAVRKHTVGECYVAYWESPLSHTTRSAVRPEAQIGLSSRRYTLSSPGEVQHSGRDARCSGVCSFDLASSRGSLLRQEAQGCWQSSSQRPLETKDLGSPVQQQLQYAQRGLSSSLFSAEENPPCGTGMSSVPAHARAYWALERPFVPPQASVAHPVLASSVPVAPTCSSPEAVRRDSLQRLFTMNGRRPCSSCASEAGPGLERQPSESEQHVFSTLPQPVGLMPLQHPQSPAATSVGGACRTVSISRSGLTERAMSTPVAPGWQNAPACERLPSWSASECHGLSLAEGEPSSESRDKKGNGFGVSFSGLERGSQLLDAETTRAQTNNVSGCRSSQSVSRVDSGHICSRGSKASPVLAATRLQARASSRFVSPVDADCSPSTSICSVSGGTPSGSCLLCCTNLSFQNSSTNSLPSPRSRLRSTTFKDRRSTNDNHCVEASQEHSDGTAKVESDPHASRVKENRKLRHIVQALYKSVHGNQGRSEQQPLDEYEYTASSPASRSRSRRYTVEQRQIEQQHPIDKRQPQGRRRVGLRRRLSRRWLSRSRPAAAASSSAGGAPDAAVSRRHCRRLRLYRRRNKAITNSRLTLSGNTVPGSDSACEMLRNPPRRARTAASLSKVRGTSKRLIRLQRSLSDRVRRGTLVLTSRMNCRSKSSGESVPIRNPKPSVDAALHP